MTYTLIRAALLILSALAAIALIAAMFGGQTSAGVAAVGLVYIVGYMHGRVG